MPYKNITALLTLNGKNSNNGNKSQKLNSTYSIS